MLSHSGPAPLYRQVKLMIRENIETGRWQAGQQIPSERELCEQHGISRTTVRLALADAINEGLLYRIHGKGTFVALPKVKQPLFQITSFEETMRAHGWTPQTMLLESGLREMDPLVAGLLQMGVGGRGLFFRLLGLASGEPMAVYDSYVPPDTGAFLPAEIRRLAHEGKVFFVNRLIAAHYGWPFLQAEQTYEAGAADKEAAQLLQLRGRSPVLLVTSLFTDPKGRPVEYRKATYRADKYQFNVTRHLYFAPGVGVTEH